MKSIRENGGNEKRNMQNGWIPVVKWSSIIQKMTMTRFTCVLVLWVKRKEKNGK